MTEDAFEPDDCEAILIENDTKVRISFRNDSGASREVTLERRWLPQLVQLLVSKIESGPVVPKCRDGPMIHLLLTIQRRISR